MGKVFREKVLILAKTYPSPSSKYSETSCVAGVNEKGVMRRIFPVPFRLIEKEQQFKKWQWVEALVEKAPADHRRESHRIYVDSICCGETIDSRRNWSERMPWVSKIPTFEDFDEVEEARKSEGVTLALLKPKRLIDLQLTDSESTDWTDDERESLVRHEMQGSLFSEEEARQQVKMLRKVPHDFHYRYICDSADGEKEYRHKIVDWEAGALYWKCRSSHGDGWHLPFREKYESFLPGRDLMFLMGNIHRFPHQWLIISVLYPPKPVVEGSPQESLF